MADPRPIGIFDSGVGGLTVARAIVDLMPNESVIYVGDSARGPYGDLDLDVVRSYALEIVEYLASRDVKIVVIACNTASSAALDRARERFHGLPVMGVVEPGIHSALQASSTGKIGLIGTRGTIASGAYDEALRATGKRAELFSQACPGLVEFVEAGKTDGREVEELSRSYLEPLLDKGIDTLLLGCTHYPLLARVLKRIVGDEVTLVDSADSTAFAVYQLLASTGMLRRESTPSERHFVCSGDPEVFLQAGVKFFGPEVDSVEKVVWHSEPRAAGGGSL
ncbi:MAG: glutamate racemase [Acidimicrobiia bacterium]